MSFEKLPKLTFWRVVLGLILSAGFYASLLRFTKGLGAATNLTDRFPWGLWIGFDVVCGVGLAAAASRSQPRFTFSISAASIPSCVPQF